MKKHDNLYAPPFVFCLLRPSSMDIFMYAHENAFSIVFVFSLGYRYNTVHMCMYESVYSYLYLYLCINYIYKLNMHIYIV